MISHTRLYRDIRQFAVSTPIWGECIRYQTLPDERANITLISQRVYGNRDEFIAIMAAAGLDRFDDPVESQVLVLPTAAQLSALKKRAGV